MASLESERRPGWRPFRRNRNKKGGDGSVAPPSLASASKKSTTSRASSSHTSKRGNGLFRRKHTPAAAPPVPTRIATKPGAVVLPSREQTRASSHNSKGKKQKANKKSSTPVLAILREDAPHSPLVLTTKGSHDPEESMDSTHPSSDSLTEGSDPPTPEPAEANHNSKNAHVNAVTLGTSTLGGVSLADISRLQEHMNSSLFRAFTPELSSEIASQAESPEQQKQTQPSTQQQQQPQAAAEDDEQPPSLARPAVPAVATFTPTRRLPSEVHLMNGTTFDTLESNLTVFSESSDDRALGISTPPALKRNDKSEGVQTTSPLATVPELEVRGSFDVLHTKESSKDSKNNSNNPNTTKDKGALRQFEMVALKRQLEEEKARIKAQLAVVDERNRNALLASAAVVIQEVLPTPSSSVVKVSPEVTPNKAILEEIAPAVITIERSLSPLDLQAAEAQLIAEVAGHAQRGYRAASPMDLQQAEDTFMEEELAKARAQMDEPTVTAGLEVLAMRQRSTTPPTPTVTTKPTVDDRGLPPLPSPRLVRTTTPAATTTITKVALKPASSRGRSFGEDRRAGGGNSDDEGGARALRRRRKARSNSLSEVPTTKTRRDRKVRVVEDADVTASAHGGVELEHVPDDFSDVRSFLSASRTASFGFRGHRSRSGSQGSGSHYDSDEDPFSGLEEARRASMANKLHNAKLAAAKVSDPSTAKARFQRKAFFKGLNRSAKNKDKDKEASARKEATSESESKLESKPPRSRSFPRGKMVPPGKLTPPVAYKKGTLMARTISSTNDSVTITVTTSDAEQQTMSRSYSQRTKTLLAEVSDVEQDVPAEVSDHDSDDSSWDERSQGSTDTEDQTERTEHTEHDEYTYATFVHESPFLLNVARTFSRASSWTAKLGIEATPAMEDDPSAMEDDLDGCSIEGTGLEPPGGRLGLVPQSFSFSECDEEGESIRSDDVLALKGGFACM